MTTQFVGNSYKNQLAGGQHVAAAVKNAAQRTGADFSFLMKKAATESSFNPRAKAKGSSATGLFQFIEQTWLTMVKKHGDKYGLSAEADKISLHKGKAYVADPAARSHILNLRKNPEISALMAGEYCAENQNYLEDNTHCEVGATELYLAHFMGAGGAAKFLNSRSVNGEATAAHLFPAAARANKSIFFDRATGQARSLNDIYDHFASKFNNGSSAPPATDKPASPSADYPADFASAPDSDSLSLAAQTLLSSEADRRLPSFDDGDEKDDIIWNDDPRFFQGPAKKPAQKISPFGFSVMIEAQEAMSGIRESRRYNS